MSFENEDDSLLGYETILQYSDGLRNFIENL